MGDTEDLAMLGSCSAKHGRLLSAPLQDGGALGQKVKSSLSLPGSCHGELI